MRNLKQWINYRTAPSASGGTDKIPIDATTGRNIDPHDPSNWLSYADAVATGHPVGFVFTASDPYFFLDLDKCATEDGRDWKPHALEALAAFPGAMVERSISGRGLHVFGRYTGEAPDHGTRCAALSAELYTSGRFVALGTAAQGDPDVDCTAALHAFAARHFPPRGVARDADWTDGPREDWTGPTDDDELIAKARAAKSTAAMFGAAASFDQLWRADDDALAAVWPGTHGPYDASAADSALARHLAFWTGCDCERIVRLMRRSELVRDKWDREDYMTSTVLYAVARTDRVYDVAPPVSTPVDPDDPEPRSGYQFLTPEGQLVLFKGCTYVISRNRICLPNGRLLNRDQFNAAMPTYEFALSTESKAKTTRKPWEAYLENMANAPVIADEVCFEPASGWGEPIVRGDVRYCNTYRPVETPRKPGDAGPFLEHMRRLLPDERDREILTAYMAAVVQHKGVKFQWAPLIQGVEGNGKTLFSRVLREAIGEKYTHMPQASELGQKFNKWLVGNILACVEDIYVPNDRWETLERLKPMITSGDGIGIRAMNADEETARTCCNFMFNSNHRDAVAKTENDRRFCVFYTAQQTRADLDRDGMGPDTDYHPSLYRWLNDEGYAIVHDYLATYEIPDELNPATSCQRAPTTSTTHEAILEGRSRLHEEIEDIIDSGLPGYKDGWVSRIVLCKDLQERHVRSGPKRVREALTDLGYELHPALAALPRPRTHRPVKPDGQRAELWIRKGHVAGNFDTATGAADAYTDAQLRPNAAELFGGVRG